MQMQVQETATASDMNDAVEDTEHTKHDKTEFCNNLAQLEARTLEMLRSFDSSPPLNAASRAAREAAIQTTFEQYGPVREALARGATPAGRLILATNPNPAAAASSQSNLTRNSSTSSTGFSFAHRRPTIIPIPTTERPVPSARLNGAATLSEPLRESRSRSRITESTTPPPTTRSLAKGPAAPPQQVSPVFRMTPDKRFSVLDFIRIVTNNPNSFQLWSRVKGKIARELAPFLSFHKFKGRGQHQTPVVRTVVGMHLLLREITSTKPNMTPHPPETQAFLRHLTKWLGTSNPSEVKERVDLNLVKDLKPSDLKPSDIDSDASDMDNETDFNEKMVDELDDSTPLQDSYNHNDNNYNNNYNDAEEIERAIIEPRKESDKEANHLNEIKATNETVVAMETSVETVNENTLEVEEAASGLAETARHNDPQIYAFDVHATALCIEKERTKQKEYEKEIELAKIRASVEIAQAQAKVESSRLQYAITKQILTRLGGNETPSSSKRSRSPSREGPTEPLFFTRDEL